MRRIPFFLLLLLLFVATIGYSQTIIYPFETAVQDSFFHQYPKDIGYGTGAGFTTLIDTIDHHGSLGTHSLKMEWNIDCNQSWGGWQGIAHFQSNHNIIDLSSYTYLTIWYKIIDTSSVSGSPYMRFRLYDAGTTYWTDSTDHEEWYCQVGPAFYSQTPGVWRQLYIALKDLGSGSPDSTGFHLPGWSGKANNGTLDLNNIVGWDLEVNCDAQGVLAHGSVEWDDLQAWGVRELPYIIYTGKDFANNIWSGSFTWCGCSMTTVAGGGPTGSKLNAWQYTFNPVAGNCGGWAGAGFNIPTPANLNGAWQHNDSLKFMMKADIGTGPLRAQFETAAAGKRGSIFTPLQDGLWHQYALALNDFIDEGSGALFDPSVITVFQIMTEPDVGFAWNTDGLSVYLTNVWIGNPTIDVVPPEPPTGLDAAAGSYQNVFSWNAVPNEYNCAYNVYFADHAWTVETDSTVEDLPPYNILSTNATHVLRAPNTDQDETFYYGVLSKDAAGNTSIPALLSSPLTTKARGVPTIAKNPPANFAADGDMSEWEASGIKPFFLSKDSGYAHVNENGVIDNDQDCSAKAYIAVDPNYLYVAFDVTDDVVKVDTTGATGGNWMQDSPDLFIGLYDWRGKHHSGLAGGATPEYHLRFCQNEIILDGLNVVLMYQFPGGPTTQNPDYIWIQKVVGSGYIVEAKIPFTAFANARTGDKLFVPQEGMRIPIDFEINDRDNKTTSDYRDGMLCYSPLNNDNSYQDMWHWTYTWIGNLMNPVTSVKQVSAVPVKYALLQNYPNPFNPSTEIKYSLEKAGKVSLKVYDMLGREVSTLVDDNNQSAGTYTVTFNTAGRSFSSGVYFYRLESGSFVATHKLVLLK